MGRNLFAAVLCTGLLAAQTPPPAAADDAPLDLEALAKQLDPGELPSVVELIPAAVKERARWFAGQLTQAEALQVWDAEQDPFVDQLCIDVLSQSDESRRLPGQLLLELRACNHLADLQQAGAFVDRLGVVEGESPPWWLQAREPAQRRARWIAAKLLREHADSPLIVEVLRRLPGANAAQSGISPERLSRECLRRLGGRATRHDWLWHARVCMRAADLEATAAALAKASAARADREPLQRRRTAELEYDLRRRLAIAKGYAAGTNAPGLEGRIARLRLLLQCDLAAAAEESRRLVDDQVAHALPYTILALHGFMGGKGEVDAWSTQALAQPGGGVEAAAFLFLSRMVALARRAKEHGEDDPGLEPALAALCAEIDQRLVDDPSEPGAIFRWWRQLGFPREPTRELLGRSLESALALQEQWPGSLSAYRLVLTCAMCASDAERAREVLLRPIPPALVELPDVAWLRARLFVLRELLADRPTDSPEMERVLGDLRLPQRDPRDAAYLRGVLAWWNATHEDGGGDRRRQAREQFARADLGPADDGWWRVASAQLVVAASLDDPPQWEEAQRILRLCHRGDPDPSRVGYLSQVFLMPGSEAAQLRKWGEQVARIQRPESMAVLQAAMAQGWSTCSEHEAARTAAAQALEAIARHAPLQLPYDRGVLACTGMRWTVEYRVGGVATSVGVPLDLWIVPRVPGMDRLKQLAADK